MTKKELIAYVAKVGEMSIAEAAVAVDVTLDAIEAALTKGEDVSLKGFGKFSVWRTKARNGRNPRTGEPLKLPAVNSVKFNPGQALKDALNE